MVKVFYDDEYVHSPGQYPGVVLFRAGMKNTDWPSVKNYGNNRLNQQSSRNHPEPFWSESSRRWYCSAPPSQTQSWLRDTGSLTRRVIQNCGDGAFRVRLLGQVWGLPLNSERRVLQMRHGMLALIRDVVLLCDQVPWVYARTLIPATTLKGPARRLTQLGERPLGAVLFSDPKVSRGTTQYARLQPGHALFDIACRQVDEVPELLWGRRTLFYLGNKPLLVNELFLPDLPVRSIDQGVCG
jgi:chorismate--pyruvate lyase